MRNILSLSSDLEFLNRVLSAIPGYITLQGKEANFLTTNDAAMHVMGFKSFGQMQGRYPADMNSRFSEMHDQLVENNHFIMQQNTVVTSIFSAYIANNQWGLYLGQQQPLLDDNGFIIGVASQTINVIDTPIANSFAPLFLKTQKKSTIQMEQGIYRYISSYEKWGFSKRQGECFFWLLHKKSAVEIGSILGLSKRTVESYIRHIKTKFQVNTSNELLEFAERHGLQHYIPKHWIS